MIDLTFVTGNLYKLRTGNGVCEPLGIRLVQAKLDIDEIQAADGELIARDKADKAYARLQKPLIVTDDTWNIPGLNNFPGPYMQFVNNCFTIEDWLRLTAPLADRRIVLRQYIVYQDTSGQQAFCSEVVGTLLCTAGEPSAIPHMAIVSFDGGKTTAAAAMNQGHSSLLHANRHTAWHDFAKWFVGHTGNRND